MSETKRPAKCTLEFKLQAVRRVKGGQVPRWLCCTAGMRLGATLQQGPLPGTGRRRRPGDRSSDGVGHAKLGAGGVLQTLP